MPQSAAGQTPNELFATCTAQSTDVAACRVASVTPIVIGGHLGALSAGGSSVAGTASNLGTRAPSGPRLAFSARASALHGGAPDLSDVTGRNEQTFLARGFHIDAAAGLFDGFRIMPTVGGFLSLDLTARAGMLFLPATEDFSGNVKSFSLGARVGVFREGFTIPGVSVSVARHFPGSVTYGPTTAGDSQAVVDVAVTSWRATVGKDLYAVEFLAGVGIDDHSGTTTLRVARGLTGSTEVTGDFDGSRWLYFGSMARTFSIVLTLAVEGGWAGGFDSSVAPTGVYDISSGSPFGAFSVRLTI